MRTVNGTANYEVFGWVATRKTAAYLIPVTLASLTTLVILAKAMSVGNRLLPRFDPTDPESLVYSADETGDSLKKMTLDKGEREPGNAKVLFGNRGSIVRLWVKDIVSVFLPIQHLLLTPCSRTSSGHPVKETKPRCQSGHRRRDHQIRPS